MLQATSSNSKDCVVDMNATLSHDRMALQAPINTTKVLQPSPRDLKFNQNLTYEGKRLILRTDFIPSAKVKFSETQHGKRLLIPVSPWLRKQLATIEEFITSNMTVPVDIAHTWQARNEQDCVYKKIWEGDTLCISVSNWCHMYRQDEDYLTEIQPNELGDGSYSLCITIPGIYYGYHSDNKLASLTMRVQHLLYKPEVDNVDAIIDAILEQEAGAKRHAKRKRKNKA